MIVYHIPFGLSIPNLDYFYQVFQQPGLRVSAGHLAYLHDIDSGVRTRDRCYRCHGGHFRRCRGDDLWRCIPMEATGFAVLAAFESGRVCPVVAGIIGVFNGGTGNDHLPVQMGSNMGLREPLFAAPHISGVMGRVVGSSFRPSEVFALLVVNDENVVFVFRQWPARA